MTAKTYEIIDGKLTLPNGETEFGGSLYLRGTGITALPEGLSVGGEIYR